MVNKKIKNISVVFLSIYFICGVSQAGTISGYNASNINIPDNTGGSANRTVVLSGAPGDATITKVKVYYEIRHTRPGDLDIWLTAEYDGGWHDYFLYSQGELGTADDVIETRDNLHAWDGASPNQTWYLATRDKVSGSTGYIDYFEIWIDYDSADSNSNLSGRITYHSYSSYTAMDSVVKVCDLQTRSPYSITKINQNTVNAMNAYFSPDGSLLVFMADTPGASSAWWEMEIFLYDFTTDTLSQLTDNAFPSEDAKFSPDGNKIVYKRYNGSSGHSTVYTCDLDGTNVSALTVTSPISHDESGPCYSPDGSKIAYWRTWNDGERQDRIWWMNSDGSSVEQLVPESNVRIMYYPAYLDSQRLAYTRWLNNQSGFDQLHIYNVTTSADTTVAFKDVSANDSDAFSLQDPDWMGFSSTRSSGSGGYDLYFGNLQTGEFENLSYANTSVQDLGGHFTPLVNPPSTRTVTVDSEPQGAGFTISGTGTNSSFVYTGTTPWTNDQMLPGHYTVNWDPLPSYNTPISETLYLVSGSVSFVGPQAPRLRILLPGLMMVSSISLILLRWPRTGFLGWNNRFL
jgi:subtilisin-like proprotein convertase family protein